MGKFLIFCRIQLKFRNWLHKKRRHIMKFQLEVRSTCNKKVMAKMRLTNLYEMNLSSHYSVLSQTELVKRKNTKR